MRRVGTFTVTAAIGNHAERARVRKISQLLVDTGSEYTWVAASTLESLGVAREKSARFKLANGSVIRRAIGFAMVYVGKRFTVDEVVFAEPGDTEILGARSLEGLVLVPDPRRKQLVPGGPIWAAALPPVSIPASVLG